MTFLREMNIKVALSWLISLGGVAALILLCVTSISARDFILQNAMPQEIIGSLMGNPTLSGLYFLCAILFGLIIKWPFFKEITGNTWKKALLPLVTSNLISLVVLAGLFFTVFIFIVLFAVILSKMYETFVLVFSNVALILIIFPPLFVIMEMTVLFVLFEKVFEWSWKNFIYLCAAQTLYLGFLILFSIYVLPIL